MTHAKIIELESITQEMLNAATQENWRELAALEAKRLDLLQKINTDTSTSQLDREVLLRIVQYNKQIIQRVSDRKADIGLLLKGLELPPLQVNG